MSPSASSSSPALHVVATGLSRQDQTWIACIRLGDERAFSAMFEQYAPSLLQFAERYQLSADEAEDVVEEVFVRLWETRSTWTVRTSIATYLLGAVRNRALKVHRHARVRERWSRTVAQTAASMARESVSSSPTVVHLTEREELGQMLRRCIERLPEPRRTAITLRWLDGLSYAEIADVLGTSVIGVKKQLNRALKELRTALPAYLR